MKNGTLSENLSSPISSSDPTTPLLVPDCKKLNISVRYAVLMTRQNKMNIMRIILSEFACGILLVLPPNIIIMMIKYEIFSFALFLT